MHSEADLGPSVDRRTVPRPGPFTQAPSRRLRHPQPDSTAAAQVANALERESRRREQRLRRSLAVADVAALGIAVLVAVGIASPDDLDLAGFVLFPAIVALAKILGLYDGDGQRIHKTTVDELPRLAQLGALLVLGIWLADEQFIGGPAGKAQAVLFGVVFVVAAAVGRTVARQVADRRPDRERCMLIGDEPTHTRLLTIFERHGLAAELVGSVPVGEVMADVEASPGNEPEALRELIAATGAHRVIIGPHALTNATTFELIEALRLAGARVSLLPDMLEVVGSSVDFDELYGITLLGVRRSALSSSSRILKRSVDLVGATALTLFAAPLMALIAVLIRLDSKGPVLFAQARVGREGTPFQILKFRTMVADAEARKPGLRELNEAGGLFKIADDPRITRVGRMLRRTSLDELPQLFNVLSGSMSLVGPRPLVADEDGRILGAHRGRLRLTPGMTGPWQIAGSARVPLEDMVKLDHLYVSNWTLWSDVKILLRTVPFVLGSRGL